MAPCDNSIDDAKAQEVLEAAARLVDTVEGHTFRGEFYIIEQHDETIRILDHQGELLLTGQVPKPKVDENHLDEDIADQILGQWNLISTVQRELGVKEIPTSGSTPINRTQFLNIAKAMGVDFDAGSSR